MAETIIARSGGRAFHFGVSGAVAIRHAGGNGLDFEMKLGDAAENVMPKTRRRLPGSVHYLTGADPSGWRTNVPCYGALEYDDVYPGVRLVYYGNQRHLQYDFVVAPGASWRKIRLAFFGVSIMRLERNGDLVLAGEGGTFRHRRPYAYQETAQGRRTVRSRFVLDGAHAVRFEIGRYDERLPLVIDPIMVYSTYIGSAGDERAHAVTVDSAGNTYIVGDTWSATGMMPLSPAAANQNVLVVKIDASGSSFVYAICLGGRSQDNGRGIAVDAAGSVYLTGSTTSSDFPVTAGSWTGSPRGGQDFFVAKLNPAGNALLYSVVAGGSSADISTGIAVNAAGEAHIAGYTASYNFPTTPGALRGTFSGGYQDAFAVKLNASGSEAVYSTYWGSAGNDTATAIAVDPAGNAYLAGQTDSTNFPWLSAIAKPAVSGTDGFAMKLTAHGQLAYCAPLAGRSIDLPAAIVVDAAGSAYVAGATFSTDFPATATAYQRALRGDYDAFVVRLAPTGNSIVYASFLGGSGTDEARGVAVDQAGRIYLMGRTASQDFPLNKHIEMPRGEGDGFFAILDPATAALESTLFGGSRSDEPRGLALDSSGAALVAGFTLSPDLPLTSGAAHGGPGGSIDVFIIKFAPIPSKPVPLAIHPQSGSGNSQTFTLEVADPDSHTNLTWVHVVINGTFNGRNACYFGYYHPHQSFYLFTDDGSTALPVTPGSGTAAENSQCTLHASGTSATGSDNTLRLTIALTFKSAFSGSKSIYVSARNATAVSETLILGTWTIHGARPPVPVSVTPQTGSGATQTFAFRFSDPDGHQNILWTTIIVHSVLTGVNACYINYHQPSNAIYLFNDAADTAWGVPVGSTIKLENSQCAILGSSLVVSGTDLTLSLTLSFKQSFGGLKNIYMGAIDHAGLSSGISTLGSWRTIPNNAPTAVSVSPATGTGRSQLFVFSIEDVDGYQDLTWIHIIINSVLDGRGACYLGYYRPSGALLLFSDDSSAVSRVDIGSGSASNSQCSVHGSGALVVGSGSSLTLRIPLSFSASFAGSKKIYLQARDSAGNASGLQAIGNWTVP